MPRKTKIIFIAVFIIVGSIMLGIYYSYTTNKTNTGTSSTSGYQSFNPFRNINQNTTSNTNIQKNTDQINTTTPTQNTEIVPSISKFHQLTDFSVAGATFFEDMRPVVEPIVEKQSTEPTATEPLIEKTKEEDSAKEILITPAKTIPLLKGLKKTKIVPPKVIPPKFDIVPSLRYVERVTGHIDEMYLDTKAVGKISNSTIPDIYEAFFSGDAKTVIYRYISDDTKNITSFMATLGGTKGEFLPSDIVDISLSPSGTKFFYITKNNTGVTGNVRAFTDIKKSLVFTSAYSEWLSQWPVENKIFLTTKASAFVEGNLFMLNPASGTLTKILGKIQGLTTLVNNTGTSLIYSNSSGSNPKLNIFNIQKHTSQDLSVYGLPEKCVWAQDGVMVYCAIPNDIPQGDYPDSWYQGLVTFDDSFVKINTVTNQTTVIANSSNETPIDGTHLFLDKKESQLFFINKKDATLWALDL